MIELKNLSLFQLSVISKFRTKSDDNNKSVFSKNLVVLFSLGSHKCYLLVRFSDGVQN